MYNSDVNLEKFVYEAKDYINELAADLGHPEETQRTLMVWKAVTHVIRDRIHMSEAFDMMSQLPLLLKGYFVDQWKYSEKPPVKFTDVTEMNAIIEQEQEKLGESRFDWNLTTEEIATIVVQSLGKFLTPGQLEHIRNQLPKDLKELT